MVGDADRADPTHTHTHTHTPLLSGSFDSMDSGGECGIPTQVRFPSPTQSSGGQDAGWWSLTHASATVIMLNTEMAVGPGSDQYSFLESTLKAVDRSVTPWVILLVR